MNDEPQTNSSRRPQTPNHHSLSLTEYAANPTPPSEKVPVPAALLQVPRDYILPNGYPDYLRLILTSRVYDVVSESPISHAINLSNQLECRVLLKREDQLPVF